MAQWSCMCGNRMTDHTYPDENGYRVYSDHDWEAASELTDDEGNINWSDFPLATYTVYRCSKCGRLTVFGESDRGLSFKPEFEPKDVKILKELSDQ